jgi:hypothetical protein
MTDKKFACYNFPIYNVFQYTIFSTWNKKTNIWFGGKEENSAKLQGCHLPGVQFVIYFMNKPFLCRQRALLNYSMPRSLHILICITLRLTTSLE